jgi:hypothetical protein
MADLQGRSSEAWWRTPTGMTTFVLAGATIIGAIITGVFGLLDSGPSRSPTPSDVTIPPITSTTTTETSTQSTFPTTTTMPTTRDPSPQYLFDLDYTLDDDVQAGVVSIRGKQYRKSFRDRPCVSDGFLVSLPPGVSRVTGVVGFTDDSQFTASGVQATIESTTDQLDDNAEWTLIAQLTLSQRRGVSFSEALPSGVQAIRLSSPGSFCSGRIAWGNPLVR